MMMVFFIMWSLFYLIDVVKFHKEYVEDETIQDEFSIIEYVVGIKVDEYYVEYTWERLMSLVFYFIGTIILSLFFFIN